MDTSLPQTLTVCFAPVVVGAHPPLDLPPPGPRQIKKRTGCYPCKRRRVKCDEAVPVCRRCAKRKEVCERPSLTSHRAGLGRLPSSLSTCRGAHIEGANWTLLDHWFKHGCRILCNYPPDTRNPFSFTLLETLADSPAATHTFQCLSAAFRTHFETPSSAQCLQERGKALRALRKELSSEEKIHERTLLTVVVFGLSTCWLTDNPLDFGLEHLHAANTILGKLLASYQHFTDLPSLFCTAAGMYMYWDMACSFLAPLEQLPIRRPALYAVARRMDSARPPHPVLGISNELILILGSIGRLCRQTWTTGQASTLLKEELERRLQSWQPPSSDTEIQEAVQMALCLRETGFILLRGLDPTKERNGQGWVHVERLMKILEGIRHTSPYYGFQTLALAMVSGDLAEEGVRDVIGMYFTQLYEHNRLKANLQAYDIVKEIWKLNDSGAQVRFLDIMDRRGWALMLG